MNKLGTGQNGSGHQVITKWSPSSHHRLKILYILGSMLKGGHVGPTLSVVQTVGCPNCGLSKLKSNFTAFGTSLWTKASQHGCYPSCPYFTPPFLILPCLFLIFINFSLIFIHFSSFISICSHVTPLSSIFTLFGKVWIRVQSC